MLTYFVVRLQIVLATLVNPLLPRRLTTSKGVTILEYALMAAVAVTIAYLFRGQLQNIFDTLSSRLSGAVNN